MRRSKRLEPVLELASEEERKAAQEFAAAETRLVEARKKLAELERYAQEYREALKARTASGIDAVQLRTFHGFIARLGEATAQQSLVIQRANEERDARRERWLEKSRRMQVITKAIEQAAAQERHAIERREQSDSDERAQRAFIAANRARHEDAARNDSEES
jgi:flagellar FliJ protein